MKTLIALATAIRNLWLLCLGLILLVMLDPGLGLYESAVKLAGSTEALLRASLVLTLAGVLWEHLLGAVTRRRQSALARALLRLQPGLQHVGAIRILIQAMSTSDQSIAQSVHKELVKLTGKDLGTDPLQWKQWLERQEKMSSGKLEWEADSGSAHTDGSIDQEPGR